MDFNFDLAEPLETRTTSHQRNFSRSLLSNIKFEARTAGVRELIDTLFSTDRDRRQIAALWGHGSYYR